MSLAPMPGSTRPGLGPRASDPEEIRRLLRSHALFACAGPEEIEALLKRCRVLRLRRNGVLYTEGEPARSLYVLLSGRIKVVKHSPDGREQTLCIVDPGEVFGEADAVQGQQLATAIALRSSRVLPVPAELVLGWMRAGGRGAEALAARLATAVGELTTLAADLSLLNVTARVARLLLTREDCLIGASGGLSQQEMASLAGTARQVVGRILRRMEEEGVIDLDRGRVRILDPDRLESLARLR